MIQRLQAGSTGECMKNNSPKDRRLFCAVERSLGKKPEVYRYRRYICEVCGRRAYAS